MNPGYAGRQELPQNLKTLFRSVAMMVPDRESIIKVKLCAVGYGHFTELARKFDVLYRLCEQQLSKQKHYDFGLRNILSVLRTAGQTKRDNQDADEELLLVRTLRDMNLSKLVAQDVPLFLSLLADLSPRSSPGGAVKNKVAALDEAIAGAGLVNHTSWRVKILQLYETTVVRHGIIVLGPAGSGKSSMIAVLQSALSTPATPYKRVRMNPKAIRAEEMFGETDRLSGEWTTGIFAAMWSKYNDRARKDATWLICDGPVDAAWIENLNTVLDDNKILTLANGDRVPMTDNVKLVFEVEDLRNASPATVSRAGVIAVSDKDLDWQPVLAAWLAKVSLDEKRATFLKNHLDTYLGKALDRDDTLALTVTRVGSVEATLSFLSALLDVAELSESQNDVVGELARLVVFAVTWGVGGLRDAVGRKTWDAWLREIKTTEIVTPREVRDGETVFDFCINFETMEWERWQPATFVAPNGASSSDAIDWSTLRVPTVETCRADHVLGLVHKKRSAVVLVGGAGAAKTATAQSYLLTHRDDLTKTLSLSWATTPGAFQKAVEGQLDKQGGKNFGPPHGKRLFLFIDDLAMPHINEWGDQPTSELVRQLVECDGAYFLEKDKRGDFKHMERLSYVAAMDVPGGGRHDIPNRLKRHLFAFHVVAPSEAVVGSIYGQMLAARFPPATQPTQKEFSTYVSRLPGATMALCKWARDSLLPSPSKFHYSFTLRDLAKLFHGILRTPKSALSDASSLVLLWRHEATRVFADKLTNNADKASFAAQLDTCTVSGILSDRPFYAASATSSVSTNRAAPKKAGGVQRVKTPLKPPSTPNGKTKGESSIAREAAAHGVDATTLKNCTQPAWFVDFLREDVVDEDGVLISEAPKVYEVATSLDIVRDRASAWLLKFNEEKPSRKMQLILFDDALNHLARISRVLGMSRGNLLLVGVG
ncbi:MAG: AAA family ATPase, partial [Planctomycetota bacterium]